ncbi:hypothetical protein D3C71_1695500 [compost metagenome]
MLVDLSAADPGQPRLFHVCLFDRRQFVGGFGLWLLEALLCRSDLSVGGRFVFRGSDWSFLLVVFRILRTEFLAGWGSDLFLGFAHVWLRSLPPFVHRLAGVAICFSFWVVLARKSSLHTDLGRDCGGRFWLHGWCRDICLGGFCARPSRPLVC